MQCDECNIQIIFSKDCRSICPVLINKNKRDKKRLSAAVCAMQKKMDKLEDMPSTSESQVVEILTSSVNDLQEMCDLQKEQIKQLKNQNAELKDDNRALKSKTLKLKDKKDTFLPLVNRCVWKLLDWKHPISKP